MRKIQILFAFILIALTASSCSAITGIFKAGMGFGIFIVILIIVVIVALVMRSNKK